MWDTPVVSGFFFQDFMLIADVKEKSYSRRVRELRAILVHWFLDTIYIWNCLENCHNIIYEVALECKNYVSA